MRRSIAVLLLACSWACSSPPEKERHQAIGAIASARAADAATYAPDELHAAEAALQQYDAAVAQRDYKQALRLAMTARDTAYDASKRAADEKAVARGRAERLIGEATEALTGATSAVTTLGTGRAQAPLVARVQAAALSVTQALQDARTQLSAEQYVAVVSTLEAPLEGLRAEMTAIAATSTPPPTRRSR